MIYPDAESFLAALDDPAGLATVACSECGRLAVPPAIASPAVEWRCYDCGWGSE